MAAEARKAEDAYLEAAQLVTLQGTSHPVADFSKGGAGEGISLHHHCTIAAPSPHHHCTITAPSLEGKSQIVDATVLTNMKLMGLP